MKDKKYPIYTLSYKWSEDIPEDKFDDSFYTNSRHDSLPEGRFWNASGTSTMFKEEKSEEEITTMINEWWDKYKKDNKSLRNPADFSFTYTIKYDTWNLTWFCHETFRNDMTDEEVLQSFERFVSRKEIEMNDSISDDGFPTITLMGAEDRWRWRGETHDDSAPCQCEHCKKSGYVRINH